MPADSVVTFPIRICVDVSPVVLLNADCGIAARPALSDVEDDEAAAVVALELEVDEHAAMATPPMATRASTTADRRRLELLARHCSLRAISMVFPLIDAAPRTGPLDAVPLRPLSGVATAPSIGASVNLTSWNPLRGFTGRKCLDAS